MKKLIFTKLIIILLPFTQFSNIFSLRKTFILPNTKNNISYNKNIKSKILQEFEILKPRTKRTQTKHYLKNTNNNLINNDTFGIIPEVILSIVFTISTFVCVFLSTLFINYLFNLNIRTNEVRPAANYAFGAAFLSGFLVLVGCGAGIGMVHQPKIYQSIL